MKLLFLSTLALNALTTVLAATTCNSDNCYNNLLHHTATAFCASYTANPPTTTNLPTYIPTSCAATPSRLSSACSCLYPSPTPAPRCILKNGDFGLDPWVNEDIVNESSYGYNQPVIAGPGYASSSAVMITFPADGIYELDQYITFPSFPTTYTLSFYAFANTTYCDIFTAFGSGGHGGGGNPFAEGQFSLTGAYQRFSITGSTDGTVGGFVALVAQCQEGTGNAIWIEGVQLD